MKHLSNEGVCSFGSGNEGIVPISEGTTGIGLKNLAILFWRISSGVSFFIEGAGVSSAVGGLLLGAGFSSPPPPNNLNYNKR